MNFDQFKANYQKKEVEIWDSNTSKAPLVSVCIQAFEHEKFIKNCLDNILKQRTDFEFEILLGEDCSRDRTRGICIDYAKKYPEKIRLFLHHPDNKIIVQNEVTGNFNNFYNLFSAKGKYIAVCEGDDYWNDPLKLQKQVNFMESSPDFSICYHEFILVYDQDFRSKELSVASSLLQDLTSEELIFPWKHPAPLTIFFRNIFRTIPKEASEVINLDIFIYSLLGQYGKGKYLAHINPAYYRIHSSGLWSSRTAEKRTIAKINSFDKLAVYYNGKQEIEIARKFIEKNFQLYHGLIYSAAKSFRVWETVDFLKQYILYKQENRKQCSK